VAEGKDGNRELNALNFRHLLERHGLTEAIFADVNAHLADKGITLRLGTLVDATIIDAPSSTKNKAGARDPEMSSTKKGNTWYFGMKAHVGVDAESGVTHSLETSTAKVHDSRIWDELLQIRRSLTRSRVGCSFSSCGPETAARTGRQGRLGDPAALRLSSRRIPLRESIGSGR
jgi:IS5 family transposase